jgi:hypothetical protein
MLDLDRCFEDEEDYRIWAESASCGVIFDRYRELSSIDIRLDQIEVEHSAVDAPPQEYGELWERRSALVREIVDSPAPKIRDAIFKMSLLSSFLAGGGLELRLALTRECVEDCERAVAVEEETERGVRALEPGLWAACERVREHLAAKPTDANAIPESWFRELRDTVRAIACQQALTSVGLKAKGEIFQVVWGSTDETERLDALQMSYVRDFRALASARLRKERLPIRQAG